MRPERRGTTAGTDDSLVGSGGMGGGGGGQFSVEKSFSECGVSKCLTIGRTCILGVDNF